jgi:hypothetical protein
MAINPQTLEFIFDYTKNGPDAQLKDAEAIDSKMTGLFSAASVIIALAGLSAVKAVATGASAANTAVTIAASASPSVSASASPAAKAVAAVASGPNWVLVVLLVAAIVCYVTSAFQALRGLDPTTFRRSVQADEVWRRLWNRNLDDIRHVLVQDIMDAYAHNKTVLLRKSEHLHWAGVWLGGEVVAVGLALVAAQFT